MVSRHVGMTWVKVWGSQVGRKVNDRMWFTSVVYCRCCRRSCLFECLLARSLTHSLTLSPSLSLSPCLCVVMILYTLSLSLFYLFKTHRPSTLLPPPPPPSCPQPPVRRRRPDGSHTGGGKEGAGPPQCAYAGKCRYKRQVGREGNLCGEVSSWGLRCAGNGGGGG